MMMNNPAIQIGENKVYSGHNLDILRTFDDNSVDSIVTDPPYELGFMSKNWDSTGIAYSVELWTECLRVLKPGGHLLAFGGSRTWHRLAVAIEDAGFEMRDSIAWLYGSGFPKSHNISKAIDKMAGAEREIIGTKQSGIASGSNKRNFEQGKRNRIYDQSMLVEITAPATDDAKKWDGWGTALKPAFEPIVVARKPLIGTVAENVLQFGTGGLNIDASRIGAGTGEKKIVHYPDIRGNNYGQDNEAYAERPTVEREVIDQGRWPANVILDETTAELLDKQTGVLTSGALKAGRKIADVNVNFKSGVNVDNYESQANSGGASRFFYVAKASKRDRNEGLDELPDGRVPYQSHRANFETTKGVETPFAGAGRSGKNLKNFHPTVKPTGLMTYLIKLVTPAGGIVLDPFTGSGSTGKAALLEGYKFVGIELTADYLPIIEGRLQHAYQTYLDKGDDLFA